MAYLVAVQVDSDGLTGKCGATFGDVLLQGQIMPNQIGQLETDTIELS